MERLALYYPVIPHIVNRPWGVEDTAYEELGFSRHNGIDLALVTGQPIYAPFECRVSKIGNEPNGSGLYVCLLSRRRHGFDDGLTSRVETTFMHLSEVHTTVGAKLSVGDVLGLGGQTGRATGSHTHMAPKRVRMNHFRGYRDRDRNEASNTFDPEPYWNGLPAMRQVP
ncbi:MAG: M23 family metallopeptidase [Rectinemataceae bacterium]|nr:M23 family metallopeptidase [Rectinemataceae bacterium]